MQNLKKETFIKNFVTVNKEGFQVLKVRNVSQPVDDQYNPGQQNRIINFYAVIQEELDKAVAASNATEDGSIPVDAFKTLSFNVPNTDPLFEKVAGLVRKQEVNCSVEMYTRTTIEGAVPKLVITGIGIREVVKMATSVASAFGVSETVEEGAGAFAESQMTSDKK